MLGNRPLELVLVRKRKALIADDLRVLVALAGHQNGPAAAHRHGHGAPDRLAAVRHDTVVAVGARLEPLFDRGQDRQWILAARVVVGDDQLVGGMLVERKIAIEGDENTPGAYKVRVDGPGIAFVEK